jgi:hypothetical protein
MLIGRSQGTFEIGIVYFSGDENTPAGQFPIPVAELAYAV